MQVFTEYFKELEEESIQDNFVVVYELLDELMDFGFPQTTDSKILQEWASPRPTQTCRRVNMKENKERGVESQPAISCHLASCRYITQKSTKLEVAKSKVPTTVTNAVSWRSEGIKYKKNEVFIDVIESINVLVRRIWHHIKKTNSLACKNKSAITSPEATCLVHRWRKRILIKVGVRCSVGQSLNYLSLKLSVVKIVLYVLMVLLRS